MIPTIFFVGEVSSGKSSLINAIACQYVTCVSLQRETFHPTKFEFRKKIQLGINTEIDLKTEHEKNIAQRQDTTNINQKSHTHSTEMNTVTIKITNSMPNINIVDFPGLNDGQDLQDKYMAYVKSHIANADMICFVTDATSAFVKKSELDTYNKIKEMVADEWKTNYHYIDLCVVVNKYDNNPAVDDDEDLKDIYNRISDRNKKYRICSHKLLCHQLMHSNRPLDVPEFMMTETKKILKNAESHKKASATVLFGKSDLPKTDIAAKGDWDNLLTAIGTICVDNNVKAGKLLDKIFDNILLEIKEDYQKSTYTLSIYAHSYITDKINSTANQLITIFDKFAKYRVSLNDQSRKFIKSHIDIIQHKTYTNNQQLIYLDLFISKIDKYYGNVYLQHYAENFCDKYKKIIPLTTLLLVSNSSNDIDSDRMCSINLFILKHEIVHKKGIPFSESNAVHMITPTGIVYKTISHVNEHTHKSWYINNLMQSNTKINKLVYLSTNSYAVIKQLITDKIIGPEFFDIMCVLESSEDFVKILEIECNMQCQNTKCIGEKLFTENFSSYRVYADYLSAVKHIQG